MSVTTKYILTAVLSLFVLYGTYETNKNTDNYQIDKSRP
jgi:hypothetical protein